MNIVLDVSNIFHRSHSAISNSIPGFDLSTKKSQDQLVRKFITDSISIVKKFKASNIYFCFDSHSFRKQVDSNYKSNRNHEGKEMFFKVQQDVYDLLKFKNLNALKVEGLEADDLIGLVVNDKKDDFNLIVSADEDVQQLISESIAVYKPHSKTRNLYVLNEDILNAFFENESIVDCQISYIDPIYVFIDKFIRGCDGDVVPSLVKKGFRKNRLIELVNHYKQHKKQKHCLITLDECLKMLNEDINLSYDEIFERLKLMCLSYEFIPQNSYFNYQSIQHVDVRQIDLSVPSILENTSYYDINYNKK